IDLEGNCELADGHGTRYKVDRRGDSGLGFDLRPELLDLILGDRAGEESLLAGVATEDVAESRRDDGPEAVVAQRPHGVLATRPGAEVGTGEEHGRPVRPRLVEHELGILPPRREE